MKKLKTAAGSTIIVLGILGLNLLFLLNLLTIVSVEIWLKVCIFIIIVEVIIVILFMPIAVLVARNIPL